MRVISQSRLSFVSATKTETCHLSVNSPYSSGVADWRDEGWQLHVFTAILVLGHMS